ncbi:DUF2293 domain-containing protein [Pelagicoccus sp. SDUM812003]|uniref:DUF2293 domain-containing protein n=1 Tax=Pelagicoccus sp. SDUM812003 TaxID=3041267 RepID=UPI00280C8103|nr:DUF2293 domain-containing protein [Pelagicoccus sp. SDUM812003]MDQ8203954.1 DUF2293 domain-containing protein [Pelagicoccus sp. SDUM812003]
MPNQDREVRPHSQPRQAISLEGLVLTAPENWSLLAPGDAALTRRVKAATPTWTVKEKRGRRVISLGVWADSEVIETERLKLLIERQSPAYKKRLAADRRRRSEKQTAYERTFREAVLRYLDFHSSYQDLAAALASRIADHAVPVGSGTVARTQRIPLERRAEAATIAWLRHQTTGYDHMSIPLIKGRRRETRRKLAAQSKALLDVYRKGLPVDSTKCPLQISISSPIDS